MAEKPLYIPHLQSAPGDFYVVNGECTSCGAPHVVAPDVVGWATPIEDHCIWTKQPATPEELDQAIAVFAVQELGCHRYAGTNPAILSRISPEHCDRPTEPDRFSSFLRSASNAFEVWYGRRKKNVFRRLWRRFFSTAK
jgi:hypothetical protein